MSSLDRYLRAAHYLAGAQIYLSSNALLREPLRAEHVKDRLLGHWGTCPGINLVYAHLNRLILRDDLGVMLITGPGHGAPANLANLYLEGSLQEFYPELTHNVAGIEKFVREFSWPGGFPSHLYPGIPGTIHEGGELGYALATAFGAAFDNPNLLVACIIGDGEAETGPTATAWHGTKFLDPAESGAVLPILHVNGYKISNPTIFGSMSDDELCSLFTGYGWNPRFVEGSDLSASMAAEMDWALGKDSRNSAGGARRKSRSRSRAGRCSLCVHPKDGQEWNRLTVNRWKAHSARIRCRSKTRRRILAICESWRIGCGRIGPRNSLMKTARRTRISSHVVRKETGEWVAIRTASADACASHPSFHRWQNVLSK